MPTIVERLNGSLAGDWAAFLTRFRVVDVPTESDTVRPLLICESPHADEVTDEAIESRYPLRGAAGKTVTKALVECQEPAALQHGGEGRRTAPVGQLVKQGYLDSIAIVNVCELPLQSQTYAQRIREADIQALPEDLVFREWCKLVLAFRIVRELRTSTGRVCDPLVDLILEDFCCRLGNSQQFRSRPAVVCGLAAQACWSRLNLPAPSCSNRVRFVAHPSRHSAWFAGSQLKENVRRGLEVLLSGPVGG